MNEVRNRTAEKVTTVNISSSSQSLDRQFVSGTMDLPGFIDYARKGLGLDAVEIEDKHFADTGDAYLGEIRDRCADNGLAIANLAFFNSFGYPTRAENLAEVERARQWMDVAGKLGCANFRLFAGWMGGPDREIGFACSILPKPAEAWDTMVECLSLVCREAAGRGLSVVLENHNHGGFLSVSDDVLKLFSEVDADNLSLLLDTGNYADGIPGIAKTLHLATRHIHLKCREIREDGSDAAFDLATILGMVKAAGFKGCVSLEYEGTQDEKTVLPQLVRFVRERLA